MHVTMVLELIQTRGRQMLLYTSNSSNDICKYSCLPASESGEDTLVVKTLLVKDVHVAQVNKLRSSTAGESMGDCCKPNV